MGKDTIEQTGKYAVVIRSTGLWYDLLTDEGQNFRGRLRGKMKIQGIKMTNPVAVGDRVRISPENEAEQTVVIEEILPRQNYIIRKSTHKKEHGHIIAANIDQAVLIATLAMPRTSFGFIDRFLVSAESFGIPVCIVFNKIDLFDPEDLEYLQEVRQMYEKIGYQTFAVSLEQESGQLPELIAVLQEKTTLVAGHSGVGKSTFINKVLPDIRQKTAEISNFANKGVHTTTFAEMFEIKKGTYLIDTPGIKEFGILDVGENELGFYFPEMRDNLHACKFYNCTHTHEPGCAVIELVRKGQIAQPRYMSYLSIFADEDNRK